MSRFIKVFICLFVFPIFLANASLAESIESTTSNQLFIKGSPSFLMGSAGTEGTVPGLNLQLAVRFFNNVPLDLTTEIGGYYKKVSVEPISISALIVPLLFGVNYSLEIPDLVITPSLGVNAGPVLVRAALKTGKAFGNLSASDSTITYGAFIVPGVTFDLSRNLGLSIEPRIGIMASTFIFSPQAGLRYTF